MRALRCILVIFVVLCAGQGRGEPQFELQRGTERRTLTRQQLLAHRGVEELRVTNAPAYPGQVLRVRALKVATLLADLLPGAPLTAEQMVEFHCKDGYSAPLAAPRLMAEGTSKAVAYLAIEEPGKPWPAIAPPKKPHSAGPFYLVWQNAEAGGVHAYEWPSMLVSLSVQAGLEATYPAIVPAASLAATDPIRKGFKVFTTICFNCHTMNKQGASQLGPDLNVPLNPSEYFRDETLVTLVRNPQNLRHWPQSKMPAFSPEVLPDADLAKLILYLKHMAGRKVQ